MAATHPRLHERLALLARQSGRRSSLAADRPPCAHPAAELPAADSPAAVNTAAAPAGPGLLASPPAPAPAPPPASTAAARGFDFSQRLARLELRARRYARPTDDEIAARLGGTLIEDGLIEIERRHLLAHAHGRQSLLALQRPELSWLTGDAGCTRDSTDGAGCELMFIDTETTGLAGGSGTLAFLVGIARVRGDALVLTQWLLTRFAAEPALLRRLAAIVQVADGTAPQLRGQAQPRLEWVSFNGKSFDLPLLAARYTLARLPDPLRGHVHHDLLHPTRTAFARHWPDCRLQSAEQRLLGVTRTDDVPGHEIPAVWADFVQFGDTGRLHGVVEHNRVDLLSLAALLPALTEVYRRPSTDARLGTDPASIARMQLRRHRHAPAQAHLAANEPALDDAALLLLAQLYRRAGDWHNATRLWQRLAEHGVLEAIEALAKYHEHVSGDLAQAAALCTALRNAAPARDDFLRRQQRIDRKRGSLFVGA
jgi:uncharacterized protein